VSNLSASSRTTRTPSAGKMDAVTDCRESSQEIKIQIDACRITILNIIIHLLSIYSRAMDAAKARFIFPITRARQLGLMKNK